MASEKNIIADPDKIEAAANSLMGYADFLEDECLSLQSALEMMEERWRDQQFKDFQNLFSVVAGELGALSRLIRETKPAIDVGIENLRNMQAVQPPPL